MYFIECGRLHATHVTTLALKLQARRGWCAPNHDLSSKPIAFVLWNGVKSWCLHVCGRLHARTVIPAANLCLTVCDHLHAITSHNFSHPFPLPPIWQRAAPFHVWRPTGCAPTVPHWERISARAGPIAREPIVWPDVIAAACLCGCFGVRNVRSDASMCLIVCGRLHASVVTLLVLKHQAMLGCCAPKHDLILACVAWCLTEGC